MAKSCSAAQKRFAIAMPLALAFGLLCTYLASNSNPGIWGTPLMWTILSDRILIGMIVGLAGAYSVHPMFRFPIPAWLRGTCLGTFVSVPLACGVLVTPAAGTDPWTVFWLTLGAGAFYGFAIDMLASKFGGEGSELLK